MAKKNTRKRKNKNTENYSEVYGVIFILIGILLFLPLVLNVESTTKYIKPVMLGVFGIFAYAVPFICAGWGIAKIAQKDKKPAAGKTVLYAMLILAVMGIIHMCFAAGEMAIGVYDNCSYAQAISDGYNAGVLCIGMGAICTLYVYPLTYLVSFWGAIAVFAAIIIIASIILFNLSLAKCGRQVGNTVKKGFDEASSAFAEHARIRREEREKNYDYDIGVDEKPDNKIEETKAKDTEEAEVENELEVTPIEKRRPVKIIEHKDNFDFTAEPENIPKPVVDDDVTESVEAVAEIANNEETLGESQGYVIPPTSLLTAPKFNKKTGNSDHSQKIEMMEGTLKSFGINAWVENITVGPAITRYELSIERGTRVSKILNLSDDIALSMAATGVRIEAPIPGKSAIGIEIPNDSVSMVTLREVLESNEFKAHTSPVAVALGKDITGAPVIADLSAMPHLLIAGQTGAGKSVCINTIIMSLLYRSSPKDVRLILVDPKKVELNVYNDIPHLLTPVVTDPKKAAGALQFVVREMEKRYETFAKNKVKDITRFNELMREKGENTMARYVVIVDELNDLMLVARGEVEDSVMRIAQLARAAGIYLILATQRPSVNVITGVIKANIPSRIAFAVASSMDSRTILDSNGAEKLVGKGDMLYHLNGKNKATRVQGAFVDEQDIEKVVDFIKSTNFKTDYIGDEQLVMREIKPSHADNAIGRENGDDSDEEDQLFPGAVEYAIECGSISISALQRRFKVGYARAGRLIDKMEQLCIVEASQGAKARKVLMTREQFWSMYDEKVE